MTDKHVKNSEYVEINEFGKRCGETHHNATLTDHEVELIRELRFNHRIPLGVLAEKFETSVGNISNICTFRRRNQVMTEKRPTRPTGGSSEDV